MLGNHKINTDEIIEAVESDDSIGFCTNCGEEHDGCEPDARDYLCESCNKPAVYGADELLFLCG